MNGPPQIVVLDRLLLGESANPSPEKILAGIPRARVSNQYSDASRQFFCGIWTSTNGKWRVRYSEHEFCVILEGRLRIESAGGERHDLRAGDAFVVPARAKNGTQSSSRPERRTPLQARVQAVARITSPKISTMRAICAGSTMSGGDRAITSPAGRTSRPRSKHLTNASYPRAPGLPARGSISTAPIRP